MAAIHADFDRLSAHLTEVKTKIAEVTTQVAEVATQIALIPDITHPRYITAEELQASTAPVLDAVRATEERLIARMDVIESTQNYIEYGMSEIENKIDEQSSRFEMRLHNSKCLLPGSVIRYPAGVETQNLPNTKAELHHMRYETCMQVAKAVGVGDLPSSLDACRQKIIEYLGVI